MLEPEISRRCRGCGAAVRAGARFCPQCGHALANRSTEGEEARSGEAARTVGQKLAETEHGVTPLRPGQVTSSGADLPIVGGAATGAVTSAPAGRETVEERSVPRVEKIRQASTVVLDEAAEDPEVRFLLVAALLFILFIVLLFMTSLIK